MDWLNHATPPGTAPSTRGSPTRRRLLALLGGLPALGRKAPASGQRPPNAAAVNADPIPQLFAVFRALLDRHEAALASCDRLEARLVEQIGVPRVALPPDWEGVRRHAAEAETIVAAVPQGRHRRRLLQVLQRRQRRWDEASRRAGLTAALLHEATLDEAVLDQAKGLLATPVWTLEAVVLKLLVLLSTQEPGPAACGLSPWRELWLILMDLRRLALSRGASS